MPLIDCPSCLHPLSDSAPACPHCGHPFRIAQAAAKPQPGQTTLTRNRGFGDLVLLILAVVVAVIVGGCSIMIGLSQ